MTETNFNVCMQANLFSAFRTLAVLISHLKKAKLAGCVALVSAAATTYTPNHHAISAAKAGLEGLVRAAATYASNNIRVNAVAPVLLDRPAAGNLIAREASRQITAQNPIEGIGNEPDLARLMVYLLSEQTSRVTGQAWSIDG
jgi:NAD(P)-dependent dehydrogenase (short-subunit alcohol dehydrogenase family)